MKKYNRSALTWELYNVQDCHCLKGRSRVIGQPMCKMTKSVCDFQSSRQLGPQNLVLTLTEYMYPLRFRWKEWFGVGQGGREGTECPTQVRIPASDTKNMVWPLSFPETGIPSDTTLRPLPYHRWSHQRHLRCVIERVWSLQSWVFIAGTRKIERIKQHRF